MPFHEELARHIDQIRGRMPHIAGEEATKQALVVPFLQVLGYDVFDPREVKPEYIADFAIKKAGQFEKVDYAVYVGGTVGLFIECKALGVHLDDNSGQLARYFNATPNVRVAMITDGVRIKVFTDLQQSNMMDPTPWLDIDLLKLKPAEIDALRRFCKLEFSGLELVGLAEEMLYYKAMLAVISEQLRDPSESFVRWVASEIPAVGRLTSRVVERLTPVLRKAVQSAVVEHVARSFERPPSPEVVATVAPPIETVDESLPPSSAGRDGVVTTDEELAAYTLVCGWVNEVQPDPGVGYRDSKSYFMLHLGNVRKWFMRLSFERQPQWVSLRHVKLDEAAALAPGVEVVDGGSYGDVRYLLSLPADLPKVRAAVITAFQREMARAEAGAEAEGVVLG